MLKLNSTSLLQNGGLCPNRKIPERTYTTLLSIRRKKIALSYKFMNSRVRLYFVINESWLLDLFVELSCTSCYAGKFYASESVATLKILFRGLLKNLIKRDLIYIKLLTNNNMWSFIIIFYKFLNFEYYMIVHYEYLLSM